jgi:ribosomal-protein-alanine acetyltransferase
MSRRGYSIRKAVRADIPALLDVERRSFDFSERFPRRVILRLLTNPRARLWVVTSGPQIVGWTAGLIRINRTSRNARIYSLAVHPDCRGKQLGKKLAAHLIKALRREGIHRFFLEVRADNTAALALYQQMGFRPRKRMPDYYAPGIDGISMSAVKVEHD